MRDEMDIEAVRRSVLSTIASIAPETDVQRIRPDRPLRSQIDFDSMDWLNLIAALHDKLGVDIPESDYERLTTLDAMVTYVASRPVPTAPGGTSVGTATGAPAELPHSRHLIDGTLVTVRPIRREDADLEADFIQHLSLDSRYARFMVTVRELPGAKLMYLTDVDQVRHVALVATTERDGQEVLVGAGRYVVDPAGTSCEFAIAVDDAWQRTGLAGILMHGLIGVARSRGLSRMEGLVLATNSRMLKFTRQLGFSARRDPEDRDTVRVVREL